MSDTLTQTPLAMPDTTELAEQRGGIEKAAKDLVVANEDDYAMGGRLLVGIVTFRKALCAKFDPPVQKAHQAHQAALNLRKEFTERVDNARVIVDGKMTTYHTEQENIRKAEEARLAELARKQEEDRMLAEAARLEAEGQHEAAEQTISGPVVAPPIQLPPPTKVPGISTRVTWKARVVNAMLVPRKYLTVDDKKLGQHARMMGETAKGTVDGVEFYSEESMAVRTA